MPISVPPKVYTKEEIFDRFIGWCCKMFPWQIISFMVELQIRNVLELKITHPAVKVEIFEGLVDQPSDYQYFLQPPAEMRDKMCVWAVEVKYANITYYFVAKKNGDFWITSRP